VARLVGYCLGRRIEAAATSSITGGMTQSALFAVRDHPPDNSYIMLLRVTCQEKFVTARA
jgi:hypothetical protein